MSENWQQTKICIVLNDKSQNRTAKQLSCDGLFHYKLSFNLLTNFFNRWAFKHTGSG